MNLTVHGLLILHAGVVWKMWSRLPHCILLSHHNILATWANHSDDDNDDGVGNDDDDDDGDVGYDDEDDDDDDESC